MVRMRVLFVLAFTLVVFRVSPVAQLPKPGPDHLKLEPLVGAWTFEWNLKAGPASPAGKLTGTETYQWLPGQFFLQMDRELKTPVGQILQRAILSYDTISKKYTMNLRAHRRECGLVHRDGEELVWRWPRRPRGD